MSRPQELFRVEWMAARHPDRPHDRIAKYLQTSNKIRAGDQVAEIEAWPGHMELQGVWHTAGGDSGRLRWDPVDPKSLPVSRQQQARLRTLRQHSTEYLRMVRDHIPEASEADDGP